MESAIWRYGITLCVYIRLPALTKGNICVEKWCGITAQYPLNRRIFLPFAQSATSFVRSTTSLRCLQRTSFAKGNIICAKHNIIALLATHIICRRQHHLCQRHNIIARRALRRSQQTNTTLTFQGLPLIFSIHLQGFVHHLIDRKGHKRTRGWQKRRRGGLGKDRGEICTELRKRG